MLTRPGASGGCSWMKSWSAKAQALGQPGQPGTSAPNPFVRYWMLILAAILIGVNVGRLWMPPGEGFGEYQSQTRVAGWPLFARGEQPRAIVAVGGQPVGVIAIGGISVGVIAIGGLAGGVIAFSGVTLGIFAVGGLAVGWWAVGGGALGYHAFGGLAVGSYAYAGNGVAFGFNEASGSQKERLLG